MAWVYVHRLVHPPCVRVEAEAPPGFSPVELRLGDGTPLLGWWHAPSGGGTTVLLMGGHGASRDALMPEAKMLAQNGFGALTLDYRHCAGKPASLGVREGAELLAGLRFVRSQPGVERVAVWGFSAGGVAAIRTAAHEPAIAAVISAGNYANLLGEVEASASTRAPSLAWQVQQMVALVLWLRTGAWPGEVSPMDDLKKISPRPLLLIFGEEEIDRSRGREQFAAAREPKSLWVVPGAGHGEYFQAAPEELEQRVVGFLEQLP